MQQKKYKIKYTYSSREEDATVTILRVLQDGMNWQFIMKQWLAQNK